MLYFKVHTGTCSCTSTLLSCPWAWQLNWTKSLYPPRHPMRAAILKNTMQGTMYNIHLKTNSVSNDVPGKNFRILQSLIHKWFNINMSVHEELLADKISKSESWVLTEKKLDKIDGRLQRTSSEFLGNLYSFKMISKNAIKILKLKAFQTIVVHNCNNTILLRVNLVTGQSSQFMRMKPILNRFTFLPWLGLT
jgi:hypothetical protein